jgi:hypothetical protein
MLEQLIGGQLTAGCSNGAREWDVKLPGAMVLRPALIRYFFKFVQILL